MLRAPALRWGVRKEAAKPAPTTLPQKVSHHVAAATLSVVKARFGTLVRLLPGGFRTVSAAVDEHADDILGEALASAGAAVVDEKELKWLRALAAAVAEGKAARIKTLMAKLAAFNAAREQVGREQGSPSC